MFEIQLDFTMYDILPLLHAHVYVQNRVEENRKLRRWTHKYWMYYEKFAKKSQNYYMVVINGV